LWCRPSAKAKIRSFLNDTNAKVYLFTDDKNYRKWYEEMFPAELQSGHLSFGPPGYDNNGGATESSMRFQRGSTPRRALVEFCIMAFLDGMHFTTGSTVKSLIKWLNVKYAPLPFGFEEDIGSYPPPKNPTLNFKTDSNKILEKTVDLLCNPLLVEDINPECLKTLQFLRNDHLTEIVDILETCLTMAPSQCMPSATLCKDHLLRNSRVACINRTKYNLIADKRMHWLKALLTFPVAQYCEAYKPNLSFQMDEFGMVIMHKSEDPSTGSASGAVMELQPKKKPRSGP
jgi:hypothetical protein